ncbi:hypothetical protein [Brevibacillus porteri]|nr:hypothetical protein [Brevibacillus porteri]MED2817341.1 hypothetical protein [Brevibacillus porteri]MED2893225.1 hypothetical protein [Brevibacillus porteri]
MGVEVAIMIGEGNIFRGNMADPRKDSTAKQYVEVSFDEVVRRDLRVMDQSAMILARDHQLPLHVFNFDQLGAMARICRGEQVGTYISTELAVA